MKLSIALSTIPTKHPLRFIRTVSDEALERLGAEIDEIQLQGAEVRPAVKPLLRAILLGTIYSIRNERQLLDQLDYNLLFRWFVGLPVDAEIWENAQFASARNVLVQTGVLTRFFCAVIGQPRVSKLLAGELFSLESSVIREWATDERTHPVPPPPSPANDSARVH